MRSQSDEQAARISKLARGVMTRLHTEVERSITFYRSQQAGGRPTRVLLAGGGAALGLTDLFFRDKLKVPVEYFQSFRRIAIGPGVNRAEIGKNFPSWASLVGAGLRALPDSPCKINILGSELKAAAKRTKDLPAMVAAGIGLGLILLLPGIHGFWQSARLQAVIFPSNGGGGGGRRGLNLGHSGAKKGYRHSQFSESGFYFGRGANAMATPFGRVAVEELAGFVGDVVEDR